MAEHDPDQLVKSEAFRIINHQIDTLIEEVRFGLGTALVRINAARGENKFGGRVATRVSYERGDEDIGDIDVGFALSEAEIIIECLQDALAAKNQIGELQQLKLRLLNDYDFTHGDNSEQVKIFGEGSIA